MKVFAGSPEIREALRKLRGERAFEIVMAHVSHMAQEHVKIAAYPKDPVLSHHNAGRLSVLGEILEGVQEAWK